MARLRASAGDELGNHMDETRRYLGIIRDNLGQYSSYLPPSPIIRRNYDMKLSLSLGDIKSISMELDSTTATQLFNTMATYMIDPTNFSPDSRENQSIQEKMLIAMTNPDNYAPFNELELQEGPKRTRRLIFYICPECKKVQYILTDHPTPISRCSSCGYRHELDVSDLLPSEYTCTECGTFSSLYRESNDVQSIACRKCRTPQDFIYHSKKEKWLSPNMLD